jgi:DNA-binding SARP family transcriptional activator
MLEIRTSGGLSVNLDGEPVAAFESDKVRALLVYLVVESERAHRRETLAGLLWPDYPERSARTNLRNVLANLRQVIRDREATPPFLDISRQTIQFNRASDAWIDVTAFTDLAASKVPGREPVDQLEEAVELYNGAFLEGFSLADSPAFAEWMRLEQERLRGLVIKGLHDLLAYRLECGAYEAGLVHARRLLELDPWIEAAHRGAMTCLVHVGLNRS